MMYSTLSVNPAKSAWNNALDAWQDWSDATFDDKYRQALLTLVEGLSRLVGYLVGFAYSWLLLQCTKATHDGLAAAVQAVPVLSGAWTNDDDWQEIVGLALEKVRMATGG